MLGRKLLAIEFIKIYTFFFLSAYFLRKRTRKKKKKKETLFKLFFSDFKTDF